MTALQRVKIYEEALEKLSHPSYNTKEIWLHDYDQKCYREDPGYTLNGLHWDYPDSVVDFVTEKRITGAISFFYAAFVTPETENSNYTSNSRFQKVPYREVRKIIEYGIRQKLAKAKIDALPEQKFMDQWAKKVKREYSQFLPAVLRITTKKNCLNLIALRPERLVTRGFGSYLEKIRKNDISMDQATYDLFAKAPSRSGIQAIEVFTSSILAYFSANVQLGEIPPNRLSVQNGAWKGLSKKVVIQN